MKLLERIFLSAPDGGRAIELYYGDLAVMSRADRVDALAVSAFPGDYTPTHGSVIGALDRAGTSVGDLSRSKAEDLRNSFGCWLSGPVDGVDGFERILCFEPLIRGVPPEVVDDFFRCIAALSGSVIALRSIAMPIFATGDQRYPQEEMLQVILRTAHRWMTGAFPLKTLKIVSNQRTVENLREIFERFEQSLAASSPAKPREVDIFIAAASPDAPLADLVCQVFAAVSPGIQTYRPIEHGADTTLAERERHSDALYAARRVMALITPSFLQSRSCQEDLCIARFRAMDSSSLLFPVYLHDVALPPSLRVLRMVDCRDMNLNGLRAVAALLAIDAQGVNDVTAGTTTAISTTHAATRGAARMLGIPVLGSARRQSDPGAPGSVSYESLTLELCMSMFTADEFRVFLRHLPDGRQLVDSLPDPGNIAPLIFFDRAVEALARFNLLADEFFEALAAARPHRREDIMRVAMLWETAA